VSPQPQRHTRASYAHHVPLGPMNIGSGEFLVRQAQAGRSQALSALSIWVTEGRWIRGLQGANVISPAGRHTKTMEHHLAHKKRWSEHSRTTHPADRWIPTKSGRPAGPPWILSSISSAMRKMFSAVNSSSGSSYSAFRSGQPDHACHVRPLCSSTAFAVV